MFSHGDILQGCEATGTPRLLSGGLSRVYSAAVDTLCGFGLLPKQHCCGRPHTFGAGRCFHG